jgi:hypothetical protein
MENIDLVSVRAFIVKAPFLGLSLVKISNFWRQFWLTRLLLRARRLPIDLTYVNKFSSDTYLPNKRTWRVV